MPPQAYYVGYLCLGVGASRLALVVVAAAAHLDHAWAASQGSSQSRLLSRGGTRRIVMCRNAAAVTVVAVALAASAAQAKRNWQRMDFSDNFTFRDYGEKKRGCVGTLRVVCTHALTHVYAFSDSCTGPRVTLCATHTSVFVYACLLLLLLLLFIF